MTDETSAKEETTSAQARFFLGPDYTEHYANSCMAAMSQWDIQITFGRNDDREGAGRDQKLVKIFLSPAHAKAVSRILAQMVKAYEEQFGEIKTKGGPVTVDADAKP